MQAAAALLLERQEARPRPLQLGGPGAARCGLVVK